MSRVKLDPPSTPPILDITKPDSVLGSQLRHLAGQASGALIAWAGISSKWQPFIAGLILAAVAYGSAWIQAKAATRHIDIARALPEGSTRALVD